MLLNVTIHHEAIRRGKLTSETRLITHSRNFRASFSSPPNAL